ncbi:MAG: YjgN family protein [Hylemonella sp.]|nr:YjgN family protein [Hylemonella sp.]
MNSTTVRHGIAAYRLRFSGSGGEYFRVWIVNLLLSIVTLGLYTPWARRRTARYFYDHTMIAGSPLEFTAPLRKMVVSFILFVLLYLAYKIAAETGQETMVLVFIVGAALLAPYIWGSAMRFRLASTRWRGLQLHFAASWKDVYVASWPIFLMAAMWVGINYGLDALAADLPTPTASTSRGTPVPAWPTVSPTMWGLIAIGLALSVLCIIRVEFNYKSLLVLRAGIGKQHGRWKPVYSDFVRIWGATIVVFLGGVALILALAAGSVYTVQSMFSTARGPAMFLLIFIIVIVAILALVLASAPARAYREARMFKLIWSNVGLSQIARFKCDLRHWPFVRLRIKNTLLTFLTLGFYRPFARVSEYRMKSDSVTLHVKGGLDQLVGELVRQQDGLGDALADVAGLDIVG